MKLRNKKTGKIIDLEQWRLEYYKDSGYIIITNDRNQNEQFCYTTFANMKNDWEDYEPKEPLIKDEKTRKVVRLCADIWEADKILVAKQGSGIEFSDGYVRYVTFMYAEWQDEIKDRTYYTIEELCGEAEE